MCCRGEKNNNIENETNKKKIFRENFSSLDQKEE